MLIPALVAFGLTLVISPVALVGLRHMGVMDIPSDRSSHVHPTPRGGGVAVGIGATTALLTASSIQVRPWVGVLVAAGGFGIVGLIDDLFSVPAFWRLGLQTATAACSMPWLLQSFEGSALAHVGVIALAVLWLISYVNAFNFMDGINGISVVQVVVTGAAWLAIAEVRAFPMLAKVGVVLAAAALAFAPFNFPRAKMFLGDAGSYFIGAWLASVAVLGLRAGIPPEAMLAPLALYLADTGITLLRRVRRGHTWHAAHRDHTYQRLVDGGWSHETTTMFVGLLMVIVSGLGLLSLTDSLALRGTGDVVAGVVLAVYLCVPDWLAGRNSAMTPAHS